MRRRVAFHDGFAGAMAAEWEGDEDVFSEGQTGEVRSRVVVSVGVESPGDGGVAGDGTAVASRGGVGAVAGVEEGEEEGAGPAGAEDEEVELLHTGQGGCCEKRGGRLTVSTYDSIVYLSASEMHALITRIVMSVEQARSTQPIAAREPRGCSRRSASTTSIPQASACRRLTAARLWSSAAQHVVDSGLHHRGRVGPWLQPACVCPIPPTLQTEALQWQILC